MVFLIAFICFISITSNAQTAYKINKVNPAWLGYYTKFIDCDGIAVRAGTEVDDKAMLVAANKMSRMLEKMPAARYNMKRWGAEIHIIGKDHPSSGIADSREEKNMAGKANIYALCNDKNLINLTADIKEEGPDSCIHQFAHNIMDFGLDATVIKRIQKQYRSAMQSGLWKGANASRNEREYWAELSMWYFGEHGDYLPNAQIPGEGKTALRKYDGYGYALIDSIYSGKTHNSRMNVYPVRPSTSQVRTGFIVTPAYLMMVNDSSKKLKLFLIDFAGRAVLQGEIAPYSRQYIETKISRVYKVVDEQERSYGYFKVSKIYSIARLPVRI